MVLQYIIVLFRVFGEEWSNGQPEVEPNVPLQRAFSDRIGSDSAKIQAKRKRMMATLKIHLEQK
jgi:hypothetical protein